MEHSEPAARSLRDYLRVLRRRKAIIVTALLVVIGTAVVVAEVQVPVYQATAVILLQYQSAAQSLFNPATGQPNDPTRAVQNQLQVITSQPVKQAVRDQLGFAPDILVTPVGQTDVIDITAQDTSARDAATIANAYANIYINYRRTQDVNTALASAAQVQSRITDLQNQLNDLNAQINKAGPKAAAEVAAGLTPQLNSLTQQQGTFKQQLAELQVEAALNSGNAQLVTPAKVPTTPASPRPARDGVIAAAAGLVLGVGAALLLDQLDDSVNSAEDLERAMHGLPNMAVIPYVSAWRSKEKPMVVSMTEPKSPATEAYRSLRTSIQFAALDRPLQTLQVTSPSQGEGKTTTLANLGVALAQVGQRVIITCCDLRRPRLHEFFGLDNNVGFTSVLLGETPARMALQDVPEVPGLRVLSSGPLPPNPAEMLASTRTSEVLTALKGEADIILIDSPPVLPVTDATVLSGVVDATLFVVTAGSTTRRQAAEAVDILRQVDAPLLATVLNRLHGGGSYGGYGYGYGYHLYEQPSARRWDLGRRRQSLGEPEFRSSNETSGPARRRSKTPVQQ